MKKAANKNKKDAPVLRIDLISDLHLDRWGDIEMRYVPNPGIEIAVVPGDLHANPALTGRELRKLRAAYKTVLFVEGNNEFREAFLTVGNFNISDTEDALRREIAAVNAECGGGVHYLKDGPVVIDGVAFAGRNGHWDHEVDPRITVAEALQEHRIVLDNMLNPKTKDAEEKLNATQRNYIAEQRAKQQYLTTAFSDVAQQMHKGPVTIEEAATCMEQGRKDARELGLEVRHLSETDSVATIVLVNHTVPHIPGTGLLAFDDSKWSPHVMSIMGNSRMKDLATAAFDPKGKVTHHLFGHQHDNRSMRINGVRYVGNPCGNPGQLYAPGDIFEYRPMTVTIGKNHPLQRQRPKVTKAAPELA